jgi:phage terminase large subunit
VGELEPRRKSDAIDDFLRAKKPDNAVIVKANWRDNPWFPDMLDEQRRLDLEIYATRPRQMGLRSNTGTS